MKVYELVNELMNQPAGADVKVMVSSSLWTEVTGFDVLEGYEVGIIGGAAMIVDENGDEIGTTDDLAAVK